jgi:hypothetical protein
MSEYGRAFTCAWEACRTLVVLCGSCDCGQRYCSGVCRREARRDSRRRYARSRPGRFRNAARQVRYRLRRRSEFEVSASRTRVARRDRQEHAEVHGEFVGMGSTRAGVASEWQEREGVLRRSGLLREIAALVVESLASGGTSAAGVSGCCLHGKGQRDAVGARAYLFAAVSARASGCERGRGAAR